MKTLTLTALVALVGCANAQTPGPGSSEERKPTIDERSYQLGVIGAFAEVVGLGVKRLALSSAMSPEDMDALIDEAEAIIARNGALSYRETDFLVTDLFPEEVTAGKHVILIYQDPVKDEYMALKERKQKLIDEGRYRGEERKAIARALGRLLSYPEERIERMLSEPQ